MMAAIVYVLCAGTSFVCALLLGRRYLRIRSRLLFWSSACFALLAVSNLLLFIDVAVVRDVDLRLARSSTSFLAMALLVYGLVWESK